MYSWLRFNFSAAILNCSNAVSKADCVFVKPPFFQVLFEVYFKVLSIRSLALASPKITYIEKERWMLI
jgi:16S rRNA G966 N2-methylase RsmD